VSDRDFDFKPPPPRREARRFEPPPWERDQFEQRERELEAQRKAEQEAAEAEAEEQGVAQAATESEQDAHGMQPGVSAEPGPKAEVDEKQVELMMLGLRAEEPETLAGAWAVSVGAGAVVAAVGLALGVWGIVALLTRASGTSGAIGGMMLLALGLCFLGIGGWLIFGVLRQRGVL
jgi:membrane-bound ClpP family serine protease